MKRSMLISAALDALADVLDPEVSDALVVERAARNPLIRLYGVLMKSDSSVINYKATVAYYNRGMRLQLKTTSGGREIRSLEEALKPQSERTPMLAQPKTQWRARRGPSDLIAAAQQLYERAA